MSQEEVNLEKKRWSEGLTGYHYLVLAVACLGWSFDTMDQWLFVLSKQHALRELLGAGATEGDVTWYIGIVTACLMIGWATGGLFFGMVGDRLGRTRTMAITILIYAGFTGLSGLAQTWQQFAILRFLTGLGIGGEFAAGAALVAETFPAHARTRALGIVQATSALGNVGAALINMSLASVIDPAKAWRWIFAVGVLPAFLVFIIFFFIKEPESWRMARDRARKGIEGLGSIPGLFTNAILRRNTFVGVALATVGVIGFWGISVCTAELLRNVLNPGNLPELKKTAEWQTSIAVIGQQLGSFFGVLAFAWMAERIGRKRAFGAALVACSVVVPTTFYLTTSFATAIVLFFIMGFALLSLFGGYAVYFPELFPTRLRSTGTGFCYNVARYLSAAAPFLFGSFAKDYGYARAALVMSSVFILGLFALPFAPETKGKPLPE